MKDLLLLAPVLILGIMVLGLLIWPKRMPLITVLAALAILASSSHPAELVGQVAPSAIAVLIVMNLTQASIAMLLRGGLGERMALWLVNLCSSTLLQRLPRGVVLAVVFIPATMFVAMFLHNITAILCLGPLLIYMAQRLEVEEHTPLLGGMLIASNLGGASSAFGDTPAILARHVWQFTPAEFASAMLPRNLVILAVLTAFVGTWTMLSSRRRLSRSTDLCTRLQLRDEIRNAQAVGANDRGQAVLGTLCLSGFIVAQFFPIDGIKVGAAMLALLIILTPKEKRTDSILALGLEPTLVILAMFVVAGAVEHTPLVANIIAAISGNQGANIEMYAYGLTAAISADGAAAALVPTVHEASGGSMLACWQLACGICAGSSFLLTSASAGPVLCILAETNRSPFTFRSYARFGIAFSLVMLAMYVGMNYFDSKSGTPAGQVALRGKK